MESFLHVRVMGNESCEPFFSGKINNQDHKGVGEAGIKESRMERYFFFQVWTTKHISKLPQVVFETTRAITSHAPIGTIVHLLIIGKG